MLKTINKCNWSGEVAKIRINNNNRSVSLFGVCGCPKWEVFKIRKVCTDTWQIINDNWVQPIGYVNQEYDYFKAYNSFCEKHGSCIYTAVSQFLYNIL